MRLSAALVALALIAGPATAQLPVGAVAPDFTLSDTQGTPRSLSDYSGQVVVLWFVGHD